jgi:hypothetical protein
MINLLISNVKGKKKKIKYNIKRYMIIATFCLGDDKKKKLLINKSKMVTTLALLEKWNAD